MIGSRDSTGRVMCDASGKIIGTFDSMPFPFMTAADYTVLRKSERRERPAFDAEITLEPDAPVPMASVIHGWGRLK